MPAGCYRFGQESQGWTLTIVAEAIMFRRHTRIDSSSGTPVQRGLRSRLTFEITATTATKWDFQLDVSVADRIWDGFGASHRISRTLQSGVTIPRAC